MFTITSTCKGGGYRYCRTDPPHPKRNSKGLYPLHIVKVENRIGRLLMPGEMVHHRDHDKSNDDDTNLELTTRSAHARYHALERAPDPVAFTCQCGTEVRMKPAAYRLRLSRNKTGKLYCSRSCGASGGHSGR